MRRLESTLFLLMFASPLFAVAPPVKVRYERLPQSLSSLGACVADGWLYVYGGHTGRTHLYSTKTASGRFLRISLKGGDWEELPGSVAVQGLALIAHNGKIYRVGGMQPRNAPGAPADNLSLTSVTCYDPATRKWTALPDLPVGRSSHDAVFVGDKLFVVGGWSMPGKQAPRWLDTMDILDLKRRNPRWTTQAQPFARRALSAVVLDGKIHILGGLTTKGVTKRVDIFDPASGKWSQGLDLPGKESVGFSPAACVAGGRIYVSGNDGKVWRLDGKARRWEPVGKQKVARFVHRIVPGLPARLIVVGGAAHEGNARIVEEIPGGRPDPRFTSRKR